MIHGGTYDITLSGTSSSNEVDFSFGARTTIVADENGKFKYSYTTDNMPEGDYDVKIGGQTEEITVGSGSSSSSGKTSQSSSNTGTEYNIVPAESLGDDTSDDSDGAGESSSTETNPSTTDDASPENLESTQDTEVQEGYIMTNQSTTNDDELPILSIAGAIVGVFCIGAIFIGYRKNKFK
ncbi:MAG: hypothetical protein R2741_12840 [Methanolobus sp.]